MGRRKHNETAFFSLGEMTTITGWSQAEAQHLATALDAGHRVLLISEQRFLGQSLYAWFVSARKGRIEVSTDDIEIAKEFDQRRRAWKRSHT